MNEHVTRTPAIPDVLSDPIRNQGVAFLPAQRKALGLTGRLPSGVLSLDEQAQRAYAQLQVQDSDLAKNVYMEQLHDRNEVLYFKVLLNHLTELLPIVYDPVVGDAIERYSHEYRRPRGIYLSIDRPEDMQEAFGTLGLGPDDVDLIVCSDAEEILGIGDWGVGGIQISVGKLAVYTAAAGIDPRRVIPVSLDVGTNNEGLLNDPLYLGNQHARVRGAAYDAFIQKYLRDRLVAVPERAAALRGLRREQRAPDPARLPGQVPDLQRRHAGHRRYRDGRAVQRAEASPALGGGTSASLSSAAGTAGIGIADQIRDQMVSDGLNERQAIGQIWIVDLPGLLTDDMSQGMLDYQRPYARPAAEAAGWDKTPVPVDPSAATRWPQMAALRQAAGRRRHRHPADRGRAGQAHDPDRHFDNTRGLHPAGHRDHERRR